MTKLEVEYNDWLVAISIGVAFLGSYLTITFAELLRTYDTAHGRWGAIRLLILMAFSLGGIGIFVMHFIGMAAADVHWHDPEHGRQKFKMEYSSTLTVLSLFLVLSFGLMGFIVASMDPFFRKTPSQIITMFCDGAAAHLSFDRARRLSVTHMVYIIARKELKHLIVGGMITGTGVCLMHYVGMVAMKHNMNIRWNWGLVCVSVLIAVGASVAAFWILFRLLSLYPRLETLRIAASAVMAAAVCGMHYTGMAAATFVPRHTDLQIATTYTEGNVAYKWCITCGIIAIMVSFIVAVALQRHELRLLRLYIRHLEDSMNGGGRKSLSGSANSKIDRQKVDSGGSTDKSAPRQSMIDAFKEKYAPRAKIHISSQDHISSDDAENAPFTGYEALRAKENKDDLNLMAHSSASTTTATTTTTATAAAVAANAAATTTPVDSSISHNLKSNGNAALV